jgi:hypothetical protein
MTAFVMLAAEHAEKSKTAFYFAGGALAAWALIVSALGITRHDFPGAGAGRGMVIAISVVLVLGATSTAVITAG